MDEKEINEFKEIHSQGIWVMLKIYPVKEIAGSLPFILGLIVSSITIGCVLISHAYSKEFLILMSENILNIFPDLLGFNAGCFAMIVAFGHSRFMSALINPIPEKPYSLYQRILATFGLSIILQSIVLLIAYISKTFSKIDFSQYPIFNIPFYNTINNFTSFLIILLAVWAIGMVFYIAVNSFNYGQLNQFSVRLDELVSKNKVTKEASEKMKEDQLKKKARKKKK